jgi:hypothetical protein
MTPRPRTHHTGTGEHAPAPRRHGTEPDAGAGARPTGGHHGVGAHVEGIEGMAGRLDATRSRVEGVGTTVRGVNVGPSSMGVIGSGFSGAAEQHLRLAEEHLDRTTQAVDQAQAGTRGTAAAYRDTDSTSAASLSSIDSTTKPPSTSPQPSAPRPPSDPGPTPSTPPSISDVLSGKAKNVNPDAAPTPAKPPTPPRPAAVDWDNLTHDQKLQQAEHEVSDGARTFKDNDEAKRYGADTWNDYAENLPPEQRQSLFNYTTDPPNYPSYVEINGYLRGSDPGSPAVRHDIDQMDRAMAGHPTTEDIVVTRGTNLGHIGMPADAMVGQTFHDPAYMSTSLGDAAGAFSGKDAVLHLRVPEGTPALYMEKVSAFGDGERELLLGRDMGYRVDRVMWEGGQWQIYGEIIPPAGTATSP